VADSRKALEREADALGIPWTFNTTDQELAALVQSRKESVMDEKHTDIPECFGICWEAVGQSVCMGCNIKDPCRHKFALGRLKDARAKLGKKVSIEGLCLETGVNNPEAVMAALEYAEQHGEPPLKVGAPAKKPVAPPPPEAPPVAPPEPAPSDIPPPPDAVEAPAIPPPPGGDDLETKMYDDPDLENRRLNYAPDPTPPAAEPPPPAQEDPVPETKPKKAPKAKKGKKAAPASHPPKAGSAKRASGPALATAKRSAPSAKAQESPRRTWGEQTWEARWQRERERSKDIAQLTPGMKLRPQYKGAEYLVEVTSYGYRYQGGRYPTLYAVMVDILGTYRDPTPLRKGKHRTPTWSAPKFFNKAIQAAVLGR